VRTNFTIPDVHTIALGGGSVVRTGDRIVVGPKSIGARLDVDSLNFGGKIMTVGCLNFNSKTILISPGK